MTPTTNPPVEELIPKRIAALEVYKTTKSLYYICLGALVVTFAVPMVYILNTLGGTVGMALSAFAFIYFLYKAKKEMVRLEQKYSINPKAPQ